MDVNRDEACAGATTGAGKSKGKEDARMARTWNYSMTVGDAERVVRLIEMADPDLAMRLCVTLNSECFSGEVSLAAGVWLAEVRAGNAITPAGRAADTRRWRQVERATTSGKWKVSA